MTGLYNRDFIIHYLKEEVKKAEDFSIVLADIHNYRAMNDHFGPEAVNGVLNQFVLFCQANVQENSIIGRFGIDELIIVFPHKNASERVAHLRNMQSGLHFEITQNGNSNVIPIYAIYGWANFPEEGDTLQKLFQTANGRLVEQLTRPLDWKYSINCFSVSRIES